MIKGGLEGVVLYIRSVGIIKWTIRDLDASLKSETNQKDGFIFKSDDNLTQEQNISKMVECFMDGQIAGRKLLLDGRNIEGQNSATGRFNQIFSTEEEEDKIGKPQMQTQQTEQQKPQIGVVTMDELEKRLAEERKKWETEEKLKRLEAEIEELKEENNELHKPMQEMIRRVSPLAEPFIGALISRFAGPQQPVAIGRLEQQHNENKIVSDNRVGVVDSEDNDKNVAVEDNQQCTEEEEELLSLYDEFKKIDADCMELLRAIIKIGISQQPIMNFPYQTIKNMIIEQAKNL